MRAVLLPLIVAVALAAPPTGLDEALQKPAAAISCPVGHYYWGNWHGRNYCVKCPKGFTSSGCTNCVQDTKHKACNMRISVTCPRGKFTSAPNTCTDCPKGRWSGDANMSACHPCPSGYWQPNAGSFSCYKCRVGSYQETPGMPLCKNCASCPKGRFGTTAATGAKAASQCTCKTCSEGKYAPAGYTKCFSCPAGRFQPTKGHYTCYYCPAGQYQSELGKAACLPCAAGRTTDVQRGATDAKQCKKKAAFACAAGSFMYYHAKARHLYCVSCPKGKFGRVLTDYQYGGHCFACPKGQYQPQGGRKTCELCGPGKTSSTDRRSCVSVVATTTKAPAPPIDCQVLWDDWGRCSATCAGGVKTRTAIIVTQAANGGKACPTSLKETQACSNGPCPVHCKTSAFSAWTKCNRSCGGGTQSRSRSIVTHTRHGGEVCPFLTEQRPCNDRVTCPAACVLSQWSTWSKCNHSCGSASVQRRSRSVIRAAIGTGAKCPVLIDTRRCTNLKPCPRDCVLTEWTFWSSCTRSCGGGKTTRSRGTVRTALYGGVACGNRKEERSCNNHACPIDCEHDITWGQWSKCTASCAGGTQISHKAVKKAAQYGGKACHLRMERKCNVQPCPIDCVMGIWGHWSACTKSCGTGIQRRSRKRAVQEEYGGKPCVVRHTTEDSTCNSNVCPQDCAVSNWASWTACSLSCDDGNSAGWQIRRRTISASSMHGGKSCPPLAHMRRCGQTKCPVNCKLGAWDPWTECTVTCGRGQISRVRRIAVQPKNGGKLCPTGAENYAQVRPCDTGSCPIRCTVTGWGPWTECSRTCGEGVAKRMRKVLRQGKSAVCPALVQVVPCQDAECAVDCVQSHWGSWSGCSKSCGSGGLQWATRTTLKLAQHNGAACGPAQRTRHCNAFACPIDCSVGAWGSWGKCSATCGRGKRPRYRIAEVGPKFGGKLCPPLIIHTSCNAGACPVHCKLGEWGQWGECSSSCGPGTRPRTRAILTQPSHGGLPCKGTKITMPCTLGPCPIHCEVSPWGKWSSCSKTCGGGEQHRERFHVVQPSHGGSVCPYTSENRPCNDDLCAVDCTVTAWTSWSACDASCGGGQKVRTRIINVPEAFGGKGCPPLSRTSTCNVHECPVDCKITVWGAWGTCSRSCGGGLRQRTRSVIDHPFFGGANCPVDMTQTQPCKTFACPVDCKVSQWGQYSACSKSCGGGQQLRYRAILHQSGFGGLECPTTKHKRMCNQQSCPYNCRVSHWSSWSACTHTCGKGTRKRVRQIYLSSRYGGASCPALVAEEPCNDHSCPMDCTMSAWSAWSDCSVSCGAGSASRKRTVRGVARFGGKTCAALQEKKSCETWACPQDCVLSAWGVWNDCSRTCGFGASTRERTVAVEASRGGKACSNTERFQTRSCSLGPCPVDCAVGVFSSWTTCSVSCGGGTQTRKRIVQAKRGKRSVCSQARDTRGCGFALCPVDCVMNKWSVWSACSATCGLGFKTRSRTMKSPAKNGGANCGALSSRAPCEVALCPVACRVSHWGGWSDCTDSCGTGKQTRLREILSKARRGGRKCPALKELRNCNAFACPVDCIVKPWGSWNHCSRTCGGGTQFRVRKTISPQAGGEICPRTTETRVCNDTPCPKACVMSLWGQWTKCTVTCGDGFQSRHRHVLSAPIGTGAACTSKAELRRCATAACPVDCKLSSWGSLGSCSKHCGGGKNKRYRHVLRPGAYGGYPCGHLSEFHVCNTKPCATTNCRKLTDWGAWNACSQKCGGGVRRRTRAYYGPGSPCAATLVQTQTCNMTACPVNCKASAWSTWQPCSVSCGTGTSKRYRSELVPATFGGKKCLGALSESRTCSTKPCPVDCVVDAWNTWGQCSETCNGGVQYRTRTISRMPSYGGKKCPVKIEERQCNTVGCPVDCEVSAWGAWSKCSQHCGGGQQARTRSALTAQLNGGARCPQLREYRVCNTKVCKCSHIRCHYATHKRYGRTRIFVTHDKNEFMGQKHKCAYNYQEQACECKCFNDLPVYKETGYWKQLDDLSPRGGDGQLVARDRTYQKMLSP